MPTCPDCGSIIMEGDPYCSHCGAHLSWSDDYSHRRDSQIPNPPIDFYDPLEDAREYERRHQELLKKISETYKVKLEDLDIKDGYTEYIFLRKTPYYTLKIVATDQYGATIGIKWDSTEFDYTKLKENTNFKDLTKDLDLKKISTNIYRDEIHIFTEDKCYLVDMENNKLIEEEHLVKEMEKYCPNCNKVYADMEYKYCTICSAELKTREKK